MALSNILREPRRELIEQGIGTAAVLGFVAVDFAIIALISALNDDWPHGGLWVFAFVIIAAAIGALFLIFIVIHAVGEAICNSLTRRGFDPRPANRR